MCQKKRLDWVAFLFILMFVVIMMFIPMTALIVSINSDVEPVHKPEILVTKEYFMQSLAYGPGIAIEYSVGGIACVQYFYVNDEIAYREFIQHLEDEGRLRWAGQRIKWPDP